jgi:cytidyltransferase-like protein
MAMNVGMITGSFDMLHLNHLKLLRKCKQRCKTLVVGLVSDELAILQKRKSIMTYKERKETLLYFVDVVVPFCSEPRDILMERYNVDLFFSTSEYRDAAEFANVPPEKLHFFDRTPGVSTSNIIDRIERSCLSSSRTKTLSIGGPIISAGKFVLKTISLSQHEVEHNTADVFGMHEFPTNCRNWDNNVLPLVSGANGNRETAFYQRFMDAPWLPVVHINESKVLQHGEQNNAELGQHSDESSLIGAVNRLRERPYKTMTVLMRDAGMTLDSYFFWKPDRKPALLQQLDAIIDTIRDAGYIHGDLHPHNILVDPLTEQVSIIDAGWAQSMAYHMTTNERQQVVQRLVDNFDAIFFLEKLTSSVASCH